MEQVRIVQLASFEAWERFKEIKELLAHYDDAMCGECSLEYLLSLVSRGLVQVFFCEEPRAVIITEILQNSLDRSQLVRVHTVGGKLEQWMYDWLFSWAKNEIGAKAIEVTCGPAVERLLARRGFERHCVVLRRSLDNA